MAMAVRRAIICPQAFLRIQMGKGADKMKVHLLIALILASVLALQAADVNGTWEGTMDTPFGQMDNTIVLKYDAQKQKLTGRVKSDMFNEKIKNAVLKDDTISFDVDMGFAFMSYKGTLIENQLKLQVIGPDGNPSEIICTRKDASEKKK
jgi:hypothetical protein